MFRACQRTINVLLCFMCFTPLFSEEVDRSFHLMPVPAKIEMQEGTFRLDESMDIYVKGEPDGRLYRGATRFLRRLAGRTGLFFTRHYVVSGMGNDRARIVLQCRRPGKIVLKEDESYSLHVSPERILISAETDIGVLHGLHTLIQLLEADEDGYYFPAVAIYDEPRFQWRGLLIDVGRHFLPVDVIKRNLDGMAAVKLNVLHWHLTEDQGFRVECKTFPRLHELGSDGLYYTQEQIQDIIAYAADRGIRVMPEFDMPGHATSWFVGYPELASAKGPYSIIRRWGVCDPVMDPTRDQTYIFLDAFFKEMAALFPDEYMHIGGDENNGKQWNANPNIQAFMKERGIPDNHAMQSYFNNRLLDILTKYGKKMVGWDEIFHPDMPTNIVIHSWRGRKAMKEAAQRGYQTILSNGYYIDLIQPTDILYLNDPIPDDSPLSENEKRFILGGEATMWGEYVSWETVDSRIWPRTAAIAERFWSPGRVRDVEDMYIRLDCISRHLEEFGLTHEKNVDMMLRRLSNSTDIRALKVLVDVIEPVKGYKRGAQKKHTSTSSLTRMVDAARPDARTAREFRKRADQYVKDPLKGSYDLNDLTQLLVLWKKNHDELLPVIQKSPALKEIKTLSEDLSRIAGIGLEALNYIQTKQNAGEDWLENKLNILEKSKLPRAQTELMIVSAIELLVRSAEKQKSD